MALSGVAAQSSTKSPVVLAPKFASVAARVIGGASTTRATATIHPFNFMLALPLRW